MEPGEDAQWWLTVPPETLQAALTLSQTVWWVDSETSPHLVDSMTAEHRLAVIDFLVLRAPDLLIDIQETKIRSRPGSAPHRAATLLLAGQAAGEDRHAWLEATPLMRRLRLLTRGLRES